MISTHAPLAGRDFWGRLHRGCLTNFNPRAPCGARPAPHFGGVFSKKFQPTRPLRGATNLSCGLCGKNKNFNPRAPCGARPTPTRSQCCRNGNFNPRAPCGARQARTPPQIATVSISTHAPLAGRDSKSVQITMHIFAITDKFQMLLHRMPPVRAFCSFLMQENHADFGCEPPK